MRAKARVLAYAKGPGRSAAQISGMTPASVADAVAGAGPCAAGLGIALVASLEAFVVGNCLRLHHIGGACQRLDGVAVERAAVEIAAALGALGGDRASRPGGDRARRQQAAQA